MKSIHYFREKGASAERIIHELGERTFFTDWCYTNPKKPDGKEICDLLIVFDGIAIIWQIKDLKVDELGRYKQAEIEKNLRQLAGARRALFELKTPIRLQNPRRGNEIFDPTKISQVYLISVLMGDSTTPFPMMDTVKDHQLHVFTREFADIVLTELDTVADFCNYLRDKEAISTGQIIITGGEENLLALYLGNGRSFHWAEKADFMLIDDSLWPALIGKPEFQAKKKEDQISCGWDSLIETAHTCGHGYERVAKHLAKPARFERRILSKAFLEVYAEFRTSTMGMLRRKLAVGDTVYCFLISSEPEERREYRKQMLGLMCFVARGLEDKRTKVIGVATDRENRSYDFVYLEMPSWTAKNEEYMKGIQEDLGIFTSPRISLAHEDEYPSE
jgi:hypothetical protein